MDFIPINSIADIDPDNISIRDINKRYIDRDGNRYATRFNLQTRRVEVVRIVKTRAEAQRVSQQIKRQRLETRRAERQPVAAPDDLTERLDVPDEHTDLAPPPTLHTPDFDDLAGGDDPLAPSEPAAAGPSMQDQVFVEQHLIDEIVSHLSRCKERQQVVMNNLKNSRCFDTGGELSDLTREIDVDCWQASDNAINYHKELYGYPRSVAQYLIRLTPEERTRVDALPDDAAQMEVIRRLESRRAFEDVYQKVLSTSNRMLEMVQSVPEETAATLMAAQRQQLEDATASTEILLSEVHEKIHQIEHWKKRYA